MKKIKLFSFSLAIIMCLAVSAHATGIDTSANCGIIDFSSIETNPDVSVSEIMTFSEMVERYAENAGITYQEALEMFPSTPIVQSTNDIYYRVFTAGLDVSDMYKPHLEFFCETSEGGHFRNINSIYSVQLVRSYRDPLTQAETSKQFSGDVEVWLRNTYTIEYMVNGDFYNNGTTTVSGGAQVNIKINESAKINFSVSGAYASNHYKYFYVHKNAVYGAG